MGWCGGTSVMCDLIYALKTKTPWIGSDTRQTIYEEMIESLSSMDWDCTDEPLGEDPSYDAALEAVNRRWCEKNGEDYDDYFGVEDE